MNVRLYAYLRTYLPTYLSTTKTSSRNVLVSIFKSLCNNKNKGLLIKTKHKHKDNSKVLLLWPFNTHYYEVFLLLRCKL